MERKQLGGCRLANRRLLGKPARITDDQRQSRRPEFPSSQSRALQHSLLGYRQRSLRELGSRSSRPRQRSPADASRCGSRTARSDHARLVRQTVSDACRSDRSDDFDRLRQPEHRSVAIQQLDRERAHAGQRRAPGLEDRVRLRSPLFAGTRTGKRHDTAGGAEQPVEPGQPKRLDSAPRNIAR